MPLCGALREQRVTQGVAEDIHQEFALERRLLHPLKLTARLKIGPFQDDGMGGSCSEREPHVVARLGQELGQNEPLPAAAVAICCGVHFWE